MATSSETPNTKSEKLSLPIKESWFSDTLYLYQGFWCLQFLLDPIIAIQTHFQALDDDIILASSPKCGTTWLKSLIFTVVNRKNLPPSLSKHTLNSKNPHDLVLYLDLNVYFNSCNRNQLPDLTEIPSPRLFATHVPYPSLPDSIKTSKCRIVYVCRNPLDTFVSFWHFSRQILESKGKTEPKMRTMEECVRKYSMGISPFGPQDDHILGYWEESKKNPQKVLFLEYEGLKKEPKTHLKKLAEFLGCPFSKEEEDDKVVDDIIDICSLKNLKEKEVNKNGSLVGVEYKFLFRKGEVGGWTNYLTPSMAKQFNQMLQKLKDAGFSFSDHPMNI